MIDYSLKQLANIIDGKVFNANCSDGISFKKIVTDSRIFFNEENAVFFALIGPRNNGHNYIQQLIEKGVLAFVVSEKESIDINASFILVKNTTVALQKLASHLRRQVDFPIIAVTGSNGKTIVKEWLFDILSNRYAIVRSPKSYNSQIGVPVSVLLLNKNYNLGIFEAGISEPGEMQGLEKIIRPTIGVLTNIGDAHQENFISTKEKLHEKLKLFKNCKKLIFCSDSEIINKEVSWFCKENNIEPVSWSLENSNSQISFSASQRNNHTNFTAIVANKKYLFSIPFTNYSALENACNCFATCYALNTISEEILKRFPTLETVAMRLEIKQGINNCLLINDYYNSDLNSLSIALSVLQQQAAKKHLYKKVVLSDIKQSGLSQHELYTRVNQLLLDWKIDEITGVGPEISKQSERFTIKKSFYNSLNSYVTSFNRNNYKSSGILIKGARQFTFEKISELLEQKTHQTVLEINLNALVNNLNFFRNLLQPSTKIMAMVKAFSYGSGDVEIAKLLQYQNIDYLAVAVTDEGVMLRNAGIITPIIVMSPEVHSFQNIIDYGLEPNIYSTDLLVDFIRTVSENAILSFPVHLKIDSGMNRLGLKTDDEIRTAIEIIKNSGCLKVKSVFSHLAAADDKQFDDFTIEQIDLFKQKAERLSKSFDYKIDRHILNSAGIERFASNQFEMVRLGIGLYGISSNGFPLEQIGTLKSTVTQVKKVNLNETVGYSRKGKISKPSEIAVIPLGYADGLDRKLGNGNGHAFINGKKVPIVGNICMDMLMIDITGIETKVGDSVEFFGPTIPITEVAENAQTIPYEILTGISQRVKRVYIQE